MINIKKLVLILFVISLLTSCNSEEVNSGENVSFEVLTTESIGFHELGFKEIELFEFTSQESIEAFWKRYYISKNKPTFTAQSSYFLLSFSHDGCIKEVTSLSIDGNKLNVELADPNGEKTENCTSQIIPRTTIFITEKINIDTIEINGEVKRKKVLNNKLDVEKL